MLVTVSATIILDPGGVDPPPNLYSALCCPVWGVTDWKERLRELREWRCWERHLTDGKGALRPE